MTFCTKLYGIEEDTQQLERQGRRQWCEENGPGSDASRISVVSLLSLLRSLKDPEQLPPARIYPDGVVFLLRRYLLPFS